MLARSWLAGSSIDGLGRFTRIGLGVARSICLMALGITKHGPHPSGTHTSNVEIAKNTLEQRLIGRQELSNILAGEGTARARMHGANSHNEHNQCKNAAHHLTRIMRTFAFKTIFFPEH
jgi:hypothetical protein